MIFCRQWKAKVYDMAARPTDTKHILEKANRFNCSRITDDGVRPYFAITLQSPLPSAVTGALKLLREHNENTRPSTEVILTMATKEC